MAGAPRTPDQPYAYRLPLRAAVSTAATLGPHDRRSRDPWIGHRSPGDPGRRAPRAGLALGMLLTFDGTRPDSGAAIKTLRQSLAIHKILGYLADQIEQRATGVAGQPHTDVAESEAGVGSRPAAEIR